MLKYVGRIPIKGFTDTIELFPIGDMHIGHKSFQEKSLQKYIDYIYKVDNAFMALMGDEIEAEIPSYSGRWGYEQEYLLDEQLEKLYGVFKPLADKGKILTKVSSTHTGWTKKLTGHDIDKEMAEKLNANYLGIGGHWKIKTGEKEYTVYQQHGSSGSKYPQYELLKALEIYPSADVVLLGHIHQLDAKPYTKRYVYGDTEYDKTIWGIRTGAFVGEKEWATEKMLPKCNIGAPKITFNSKRYAVDVELNGVE